MYPKIPTIISHVAFRTLTQISLREEMVADSKWPPCFQGGIFVLLSSAGRIRFVMAAQEAESRW